MRHQVTVDIDAPAERVWAVLADVERWPEWCPTMNSVRRRDGSTFGPGSSAEVRQPRLPPAVWRVTGFEPGRRFEWATSALGVTTRGDHLIERLQADRSRVTLTVETTGRLAALLTAAVWPMTRRYVNTEATSLRRHCESRLTPGA